MTALCALWLVLAADPVETLPAGAVVTKLETIPPVVELTGKLAYSQVLVTAVLASGESIDATRLVAWKAPACVRVGATGQVFPAADGEGALVATLAGKDASTRIVVKDSSQNPKVSFLQDVMPVLARMGCNSGTCHGAADGKNGFKLSLRGYDPLFDHRSLTDDLEGRRFNRSAPDKSLMLLKITGAVPHVGGVLTQPGERYYELLRGWIAAGAQFDAKAPRVAKVEVTPERRTVPLPGQKQQTKIMATFTDGNKRDVTSESFFESSNTEVATIDRQAIVTTLRRGEATVLVRYEGNYTSASLIVMGDRSGFVWTDTPVHNEIDTLVYSRLRDLKIQPSDLCDDSEFIRRVHLDLTGLLPKAEDVRAFLADTRPTRVKRDAVIDKLVGSAPYVEHVTNKWADLLQVNRKFLGDPGARAFREYIHKSVADGKPYDQFVREILTGSGSNVANPQASYFKILRDPGAAMENTTQLFLGVRFNCNKCHDHPFERWTQDQYYQLAAYFAQVTLKEDPKYAGQRVGGSAVEGAQPLVEIVADAKAGEVKHDRTGLVTAPHLPYGASVPAAASATRRETLATWLASKDNTYFARSYVNRQWAYLMGVGLIEPIDDIRAGNPASNPALLDYLAAEFVKSGFNTAQIVRLICKSRVYQHSMKTNRWNQDDDTNYSHAVARRLPAEVLFDAIHQATGSASRLPGLPAGARAAMLLDSTQDVPGGFFQLFGKPPRESACECERSGSLMLGPVLNLVNGPVVGDAIRDNSNRLASLLAKNKDTGAVVEEIFLATMSRLPSAQEKADATKIINDSRSEFAAMLADKKRRQELFAAHQKAVDARQATWEAGYRNAPTWGVVAPSAVVSQGKATFTKQADGSWLASGTNPDRDVVKITLPTTEKAFTALRLEVLADATLGAKGPGRALNGNFVLNEFNLEFHADGEKKPVRIPLTRPLADFSQDTFGIANAIDNNPATGWAIAPQMGRSHTATFELQNPAMLAKVTGKPGHFTLTLTQNFGTMHTIGKFRIATTTAKLPLNLVTPPEQVAKLLALEPGMRTPAMTNELLQFHRGLDAELRRLQDEVGQVAGMVEDDRLPGCQDLLWALINAKAFQFNH